MKKKLIIFGVSDIAEIARFYFTNDSDYEVCAFTLDSEYIEQGEFNGLPVLAFETLADTHPPSDYDLFIALSYAKVNETRKQKFIEAKEKGYFLTSYISPKASVLNNENGHIGENCFIFEDNTIQPFVSIGDNVTLWSGNHIGHHSTIGSHSFIASHAVISGGVNIDEQCFIGVNATLRDHISIGKKCIIGAGALILSNAEPEGVYIGAETTRSKVPSTRIRSI